MNNAVGKLNETRQEWLRQEQLQEAKAEALRKVVDAASDKATREAQALEKLRSQAQSAAQTLLSRGLELPDPPLEIRRRLASQQTHDLAKAANAIADEILSTRPAPPPAAAASSSSSSSPSPS